MNQIVFGEKIAALRKEKGMTQLDLANQLLVSDKAISRWERGASAPDIEMLPRIARIFGVTIDSLLCGSEEELTETTETTESTKVPEVDKSEEALDDLYQMLVEKQTTRSFLLRCILIGATLIGALLCFFGFLVTVVIGLCIWSICGLTCFFAQIYFTWKAAHTIPKEIRESDYQRAYAYTLVKCTRKTVYTFCCVLHSRVGGLVIWQYQC